ncbi:Protein of unknown function [Cotesia congregata]|uniref:Uncharacterized protein n=1 Tax=Cotesia congregata TaxID=51543 RepID=A0A8J2HE24_COTCN|nr:Protein of unknown function [Cotesia congregata]
MALLQFSHYWRNLLWASAWTLQLIPKTSLRLSLKLLALTDHYENHSSWGMPHIYTRIYTSCLRSNGHHCNI